MRRLGYDATIMDRTASYTKHELTNTLRPTLTPYGDTAPGDGTNEQPKEHNGQFT